MENISVIGLDLAKNVFQVHGADGCGRVLLRKKLRRNEVLKFFSGIDPCLVGMEACGSAHYWGRELRALGHDVRLIPPSYVKAYVKRGKTDAADAEAICEAVTRPTMRFVAIKSEEQQALLAQHAVRNLLVRHRTSQINSLRGLLAEYGIVRAQGTQGLDTLIGILNEAADSLPALAKDALQVIVGEIDHLQTTIAALEKKIVAQCRRHEVCVRLMQIDGVGPLTASQIFASVGTMSSFGKSRDFAAWLGLTPKAHSSGGKDRLGRISKQGNENLRRLLVMGAATVVRHTRKGETRRKSRLTDWVSGLVLKNKPFKLIAVALANKMARIIWALIKRNETYAPQRA